MRLSSAARGRRTPTWHHRHRSHFAALTACEAATPCQNNTDCVIRTADGALGSERIGICTMRGFCRRQCVDHTDCPCGSFCAESCGVCLRNDRAGAATCFGFDNSYSEAELLGLCGLDQPPDLSTRPECPQDVALPRCERIDAGSASDGSAGEGVPDGSAFDGGLDSGPEPPADGGGDDAGVDASISDDAGRDPDAATDGG